MYKFADIFKYFDDSDLPVKPSRPQKARRKFPPAF